MYASITSQPKGTGCEGTGRELLPDDWSELLFVCYYNSELLSMHADQLRIQNADCIVILKGVHMSQQDLHGCS